jgi:hypothetical protein
MAYRIDDRSYFQTIDKFDSCPCGYLGGFLRTGTLIRMLFGPNEADQTGEGVELYLSPRTTASLTEGASDGPHHQARGRAGRAAAIVGGERITQQLAGLE